MNLLLKQFRKARGATQTELADTIGTTMRVMSAWERGETSLPLEDACRIADALGCSVDELCGREIERSYIDPEQAALNGYYESMSEAGRATLVESARLMSKGDSAGIKRDAR